MESLSAFLRADAARPFVWGVRDCGLRLADWVLARRGVDPAADVRGRYGSAEELAVLMGWGGLPRFVDQLARRAGLERTSSPTSGDIAVISLRGQTPRGAIRLARGWSILADGGVARVPDVGVRLIGAWRV
ncbi:MAG: hypothetical protein WBA37_11840 [Xanthobacteraceae bacterium]